MALSLRGCEPLSGIKINGIASQKKVSLIVFELAQTKHGVGDAAKL